jgi:hypothetical protein
MRVRDTGRTSTAKLEQAFFDWTKKLLQLAIVALVALGGYLIYGLMSGGVGNWSSMDAAAQARIAANIQGTIFYFNIALIVLLVTSVILYYDEESLGYVLVVLALMLYFGVPFLVDSQMAGSVQNWEATRNVPMLALYGEARIAALILILPGVGLAVYDIVRRILEGGRGDRVDLTAMQYGGGTKEIAPAGEALIGAMAACWQLPFCRESLRVRCPIYHLKRKCWREGVGCMCEEMTIRQSLAHIFDKAPKTGNLDFATGLETAPEPMTESAVPTGPRPDLIRIPEIKKEQVRIPRNPSMPSQAKRERCRNCIIYNEHQRQKYQLLAPLVVLGVPALAFWQFGTLLDHLKAFLQTADRVMANLSFDPNVRNVGLASATASSDVANVIMIACLVIIATTMVLRWLEYAIFTLKV